MGCDCVYNRKIACSRISIHAPIVGCDWLGMVRFMRYRNFNPRTHRGVRLIRWTLSTRIIYFNPRTHRGVRHYIITFRRFHFKISIHAPIVGCDYFRRYKRYVNYDISIHAPIVGCDHWNHSSDYRETNFNPRTHRGVRPFTFVRFNSIL